MPVRERAAGQTGGLSVQRRVVGPWVIVAVSGELDLATVGVLRDALEVDSLPDGRRDMALDVSGLAFCDSAGLGLLVGMRERLRPLGGRLVLLRTPPSLAGLLREAALDRLIPSYESLDSVPLAS